MMNQKEEKRIARFHRRRGRKEAAIRWMDRNTPPGYPWDSTLKVTAWGGVFAFLWSMSYFVTYSNHYDMLFDRWTSGNKVLREGAVMTAFTDLLDGKLTGFMILEAAMIGLAVLHYMYHYQGSKSIYVMKRLPRRSELWRRCITLPVILTLGSAAAAVGLRVLFYVFYMMATPEQCLAPGQWIW